MTMIPAPVLITVAALLLTPAAGARHPPPAPPPVSEDTLHMVAGSLRKYVEELPQIPKLSGSELTIGMYEKLWKFHPELPATTVFVYGTSSAAASFPGPAIEARQGVPLRVRWENHLPERHILPWDPSVPVAVPRHGGVPTVVHLHGGVDPPGSDGHGLAWFTAGYRETGPAWTHPTYLYPNVQEPGNLWYHDHALGLTRANLLAGLLGPYVVRNPDKEGPLGLPSGDAYDRHLVLADRSFYPDGWLYMNYTGDNPTIHPQWQPEYFGDVITANGKAWPFLAVARRLYRFRILNACNARFLNLSLSNGLPFTVIGSDASYLPKPVTTPTILLAPSEIFDVVIDFSRSPTSDAELLNAAPYPFPDGDAPDELNGKVMRFVVKPEHVKEEARVPATLLGAGYLDADENSAAQHRYIVLYEYESETGEPTHLYINGKRFEDPATETPRVGTAEVWDVINLTEDNHPLHIHLATFQAVSVTALVKEEEFKACMKRLYDAGKCGVQRYAVGARTPVPEHEKAWKNVVKIAPGTVTKVVVQFRLSSSGQPYPFDATAAPGYVYHCHILDHEDNSMMRPLKLVN